MSNSKNTLVISVDIKETRVALIEDGIIAELHIERKGHSSSGSVGNVVLGKVTRVLPGLQAAFIDVGHERAAFLHVEDLIRPDDFESYLAGGRKHAVGGSGGSGDGRPGGTADDELDELDEDEPVVAAVADGHVNPPEPDAPRMAELPDAVEAKASDDAPPQDELAQEESAEASAENDLAYAEQVAQAEEDRDEREGREGGPDEPQAAGAGFEAAADAFGDERHSEVRITDAEHSASEGDDDAEDGRDDDGEDDAIDLAGADAGRDSDDGGERISEGEVLPADRASGESLGEAPAVVAAPEAPAPPAPLARSGRSSRRPPPRPIDLEELGDDLPGFTISDPGEPVPRAPVASRPGPRGEGRGGPGGDRGGGRGRGRGRGRSRGEGSAVAPVGTAVAPGAREQGREAHRSRGRDDRGRREGPGREVRTSTVPNRISKSTPIREVVKEGQEIIVQISKDPIGTKGARCTSHISLPGRYVVYLPTVDHVGVSKRIGSEKERARLRDAIEAMKPPTGGLIVRTVAEGLTKKQLKADVGYLVRLWGEIAKKREGARSPALLGSELDLVLKTARDLFTDEVGQIVIDDKQQYERLCHFIEMFAPERVKDIVCYSGAEPIFDAYGIEDEIGRALSRKVPLPSGGHLIIDQAEALTAIDVNTGRFVGKGSKDMEETILKTNLEAVHEIAYQLRFRNIGGLIILDLIDMEKHKNRETVRRTLEEVLQKDKAKTTLNRISELGLIEMTRKRTRESLGRLLHEPCFYCDGTGQLQSKETIAYEILREIRRKRADLPGYTVIVNAHPAVADLLTGSEKDAVADAENRYTRKITVVPRKDYHLEQFDLVGK